MLNPKIYKSLFIIVVCYLLGAINIPTSSAQTRVLADTTKFQFWYSSFNSRSMAMANANIADPQSSNGLYSNPSLLPFSTSSQDLSVYSGYKTQYNIFTQNLTTPLFESDDKKLLLGTTMLHNGPAQSQWANTRQLLFTQLNLDIAYGQKLTSSFSIGGKLNLNYGNTDAAQLLTSNASLGVLYTPSPLISYGLVYKGTGYQTNWLGSGLSYYRTSEGQTQITRYKLPQRLEIGTTLRFPSMAERPDFVLSFTNEKLFGEPGLVYRGGLEIYLIDQLSLQGGYFHSPFTKGGRAGVGLHFGAAKFNYSYSHNNLDLTGQTHLLSITVDI